MVASYVGVVLCAGVVFLGAWRLAYWQGLLYLALALLGTTISHLLVPRGSQITTQRARSVKTGQPWDRLLLGAFSVVNLAMFLTAGLDSGRFRWSGPVPSAVTIAGIASMVSGQVLFAVAKRENAFFSSTVQIQPDQRVCESGLYRLVRHPGYLGMLISLLAFPLVLNSYWAFIPAVVAGALLLLRTVLEDRFLMGALSRYPEYAARTRWRLLPGAF